jgi:hypothetical protein
MTTRLVGLNPKRDLWIWGSLIVANWIGSQLLLASQSSPFAITTASLIDYELALLAFGLGTIAYLAFDQFIAKKMLVWQPDGFLGYGHYGQKASIPLGRCT